MGRPKGELSVAGVPLVKYVARRIRWPGPTVLVTAPGRETPPGAEAFDAEVTDPVAGAGPLQGILTALGATTTEFLIVAALDMPRIGREQLDWLAGSLRDDVAKAGLLLRNVAGDLEPLPCVFRVAAAMPHVRTAFEAGRRSIRSLLDAPSFGVADAPMNWPDEVWTNLNEPEAWKLFVAEAMNE